MRILDIIYKNYPLLEEDEPDGEQPEEEQPEEEQPEEEQPVDNSNLTREQAVELIKSTKGRIFTAVFVKKDGSLRTMNARLGVTQYLKGGSLPYDPNLYGLIPVFDIKKKDYRMININTLRALRVDKKTYKVG